MPHEREEVAEKSGSMRPACIGATYFHTEAKSEHNTENTEARRQLVG